MKKETILFFQEVFRNQVARERIVAFCKKTQLEDMDKNATFLNQILLDSDAIAIGNKYLNLKKRLDAIREPEEIIQIQDEYEQLLVKTGSYISGTMQALQRNVFMPQEIKMLHPLLSKYAHEKITDMISKSVYYLICQDGIHTRNVLDIVANRVGYKNGELTSEIAFYEELIALIKGIQLTKWRYLQRQIYFDMLGNMPQYILDDYDKIPARTIPGVPIYDYISDESKFGLAIEGRGYITNLNPHNTNLYEFLDGKKMLFSDEQLTLKDNLIWSLDFSDNPINVLNRFFGNQAYVISPAEYFQFANICILFQRVRLIFGD